MLAGIIGDVTTWMMRSEPSSERASSRIVSDFSMALASVSDAAASSGRRANDSAAATAANEKANTKTSTTTTNIDRYRMDLLHQTGNTRISPRRKIAVKN